MIQKVRIKLAGEVAVREGLSSWRWLCGLASASPTQGSHRFATGHSNCVRIVPSFICLPNGSLHKRSPQIIMAVREGFEPSEPFPVRIFSKDVLSTTQPPDLRFAGLGEWAEIRLRFRMRQSPTSRCFWLFEGSVVTDRLRLR